jgi:hypothetical protein
MGLRLFRPGAVVRCAGQAVFSVPPLLGLRVAFSVRRTIKPDPDTATVRIWGMDPARALAMQALHNELGSSTLSIDAGYEGAITRLFSGDVRRQPTLARDGGDLVLAAEADDAGEAINDVTITGVSGYGLSAQNMIDAALETMNAFYAVRTPPVPPIVAHPSVAAVIAAANPAATAATFSLVTVGKASDLLTEAARILGCRWFIRDSQFFLAARKLPTDTLAVELPRTHWLSEPTEDGDLVRVTTLFDTMLAPGRQVALVGRKVFEQPWPSVEIFRAESCDYSGDTEGGPWSIACELRRFP